MDHAGNVTDFAGARLTLPASGLRAVSVQGLLLFSAAFVLPAIAHLTGVPVRTFLPMHWPVLLVGLCYGWRSGALVGLAAPSASFLISGMPLPAMIPAMTVELALYGFLAGFFRETMRRGLPLSTVLALAGGRVAFVAVVAATGAVNVPLSQYLGAALLPGLPAAIAQSALLPLAAAWWVRREGRR